MIWLQGFLEELGKKQENNVLYSNSQNEIHLAKKPFLHAKIKHIQTSIISFDLFWRTKLLDLRRFKEMKTL